MLILLNNRNSQTNFGEIRNESYRSLGNEFKSIKDMCEFHHIPSKIYDNRVNRHHWSMEKALTTPLRVNKNEGIKKTQEESKEPITAKTEKTVSIEETVQVEQPKDVVKLLKS